MSLLHNDFQIQPLDSDGYVSWTALFPAFTNRYSNFDYNFHLFPAERI
jgi:hypothetical protein